MVKEQNFRFRFLCRDPDPPADGKGGDGENMAEICAEEHGNFSGHFPSDDIPDAIYRHAAAFIKAPENDAPDGICPFRLQQRLQIAVEFMAKIGADQIIIFQE